MATERRDSTAGGEEEAPRELPARSFAPPAHPPPPGEPAHGPSAQQPGQHAPGHAPDLSDSTAAVVIEPLPLQNQEPFRTRTPGEKVGRYTILGQLGEGGMGVVYSAYDPQLDRKVAVKLISRNTESGNTRMIREAQAMAKVTHPNVVGVYDAGLVEGLVFVAMEFVPGQNLAEWLKAERRPWQEVLRVFREAGRGLTAVHRAGLVHRDFKPENVLIGEDGRCRVSDFGLARSAVSEELPTTPPPGDEAPSAPPSSESGGNLLSSSLTRCGAVVGTRSYMAPEQFRGAPPDALTDQFSFAVALYRALYRSRPYQPADLEAWKGEAPAPTPREPPQSPLGLDLRTSSSRSRSKATPPTSRDTGKQTGRRDKGTDKATAERPGQEATPDTGEEAGADGPDVPVEPVPRWLWRTLAPALAPRPEDRYPTLEALLEALGRDPTVIRRRRLRWAGVVVMLVGVLGVTIALARRSVRNQEPLCQNSAGELASIWDATVKQQLRQQFVASGVDDALDTWTRTERIVDDYVSHWAKMRGEACVATRVAGVQSDEVLSLRMACLDRRLSGIRAFVQVFSQPDRATLERVIQAAQGLTPIDGCADVATLRLPVPPPEDPLIRAKVDALREKLELSTALGSAGKYAAAVELSRSAADAAGQLPYRPLEAELLERLASAQVALGKVADGEKTARRALVAATEGGHAEVAALAAARLGALNCKDLARADWSTWFELSRAHIARLGSSPKVEAWLENALGMCFDRIDVEQARDHYQRALVLFQKSERSDSFRTAMGFNNLGGNANARGDRDAALAALHRSAELFERALGPRHPSLAYPLNNIGSALFALGRYSEARTYFQRVKDLLEASHALPTLWAASALGLCQLELAEEHNQAVLECLGPVRAAYDRSVGANHPEYTANVLELEGSALSLLGRHDEAIAAHRSALALREKAAPGPRRTAMVASTTSVLGTTLLAAGRRDESLRLLEEAQQLYEKDKLPVGVETLEGLGLWHLEGGQPLEALSCFERALAEHKGKPSPSAPAVAQTLTLMGRAQLALNHLDEAKETLERALARGGPAPLPTPVLAEARFALAQTLWQRGAGTRKEARTLAVRVREEQARTDSPTRVAKIDAWLTAHP